MATFGSRSSSRITPGSSRNDLEDEEEMKRDSQYLIDITHALLRCRRCGWWTGYKSTKEGGVKHVDTICCVCGARLRHSERHHSWTWRQKTTSTYSAQGSGMHKKYKSSVDSARCGSSGDVSKHEVSKLAAKLNRDLQRSNWIRDHPDEEIPK